MTTVADELEALSDPARMIERRRIPRGTRFAVASTSDGAPLKG